MAGSYAKNAPDEERGRCPLARINELTDRYSQKFFVKIEQSSVQGNHIHMLIRTTRRSNFHSFFRVLAGQIAQEFERDGFLKMVTDTPPKGVGEGDGDVAGSAILARGFGMAGAMDGESLHPAQRKRSPRRNPLS